MFDNLETVRVDFDDGVTTVTLDRPEKKNSLNPRLHEEMCDVMARLKQDALDPDGGTHVLVFTGAGDAFCAGQSLDETFLAFEDDPHGAAHVSGLAKEWGVALKEFPQPTIARVNGWCFGAGVRLLCSTDIAIASEEATFGLSEVNFGVFPAGGSTHAPATVLSHRDLLYLSLSGESIDAAEADKMRLVTKVVPHDDLDDAVADLAASISDLNPRVTRFAKEVYLNEQRNNMDFETAIDYELAKVKQLRELNEHEDMRSIEAFTEEKRYRPGLDSYRPDPEEE